MNSSKLRKFDQEDEVPIKDLKQMDRRVIRELISELLKFKPRLVLAISAVSLATLAVLLEPRILARAIDDGMVAKDFHVIQLMALALLAVECSRISLVVLGRFTFARIGQGVMQNIRIKLLSHLESAPLERFDYVPAGKIVTRLTNDVSSLSDLFTEGLVTLSTNVLVVFGIIVGILTLDWRLGLVALGVVPILLGVSKKFSGLLKNAYRNARSKLSTLNANIAENIMGIREIQTLSSEGERFEQFGERNEAFATAQFGSVKVFALFRPSITLFSGLSMALVMAIGGSWVAEGELKLGILVGFFAYILSLFEPIREITDQWNVVLSGLTSAERITKLFEWEQEYSREKVSQVVSKGESHIRGEIEFKNVWFAYLEDQWVLKDLNLKISPGAMIGIVGPTGSGKSSLLGLLMRFHEAQRGQILIDGVDIREIDRRKLRSYFGYVQQDVFLFSGNLRDNLTLWSQELNERLNTQGRLLLESFGVNASLDQDLYERGKNFSSGQKQALAFVRAWLRNPDIWVLDEATAHVDVETESKLHHYLSATAAGKTQIIVAHRLSTVQEADEIVFLKNGIISEKGPHEALMLKGGLYAKLFRYQESVAQEEVVASTSPLQVESLNPIPTTNE